MSEYIVTTEQINWFCDHMDEHEPIPAKIAHLEPIVRCRDCKHRAGANVQAVVSDLCMWLDIIVKPDGFCAWGERREA